MLNRPEKPANLDAPGLTWQRRSNGLGVRWDLYWKAGARPVKLGFKPVTERLWLPSEGQDSPTPDEWLAIASSCVTLQGDMHEWAGTVGSVYDGTFASLIEAYKSDPDSGYRKLRYHTRRSYNSKLATLAAQVGKAHVKSMTFRHLNRWHEEFLRDGQVARAHGLMTMVRIVMKFGALLELEGCGRLNVMLHDMRFETPKPRTTFITLAQVEAFIDEAHRWGKPSLALAQALMFETGLRQKDVIGEWVPVDGEPGMSDVHWGGKKWIMGIRWSDIDENLILRKVTSKSMRGRRGVETRTGKLEEFDLKAYPLVMSIFSTIQYGKENRHGPLVINEHTQRPWGKNYPKMWRKIADAAGLPKAVCNKDSRAGGVTEGRKAGASLEDLRHHAGHSQISMTARYDRVDIETRNKVAELRVRSRTK